MIAHILLSAYLIKLAQKLILSFWIQICEGSWPSPYQSTSIGFLNLKQFSTVFLVNGTNYHNLLHSRRKLQSSTFYCLLELLWISEFYLLCFNFMRTIFEIVSHCEQFSFVIIIWWLLKIRVDETNDPQFNFILNLFILIFFLL